jgi:hypothetical protein
MYNFKKADWNRIGNRNPKSFICWNCGKEIASEKAYETYDSVNVHSYSFIYICPNCNAPLILDDNKTEILLPLQGREINKLPQNIETIYSEIRKCMQSGCFNGAMMLMRKLIMHIAVEEGDSEGKKFEEYIDFLCENGIVPKKSKNKADSVRTLGNSTNHEIENRTLEEAKNCFGFIELLLRVNYEFADEENG